MTIKKRQDQKMDVGFTSNVPDVGVPFWIRRGRDNMGFRPTGSNGSILRRANFLVFRDL
jgi:hypothetical protein